MVAFPLTWRGAGDECNERFAPDVEREARRAKVKNGGGREGDRKARTMPGENRNHNWKSGYILDGLRTAASAEPDGPSVSHRLLAATAWDRETVEPSSTLLSWWACAYWMGKRSFR